MHKKKSDHEKNNEQLIVELQALKKRNKELETLVKNHKQAKEKLQSLSLIVKQSTEGMALADLNGNLIFVNNTWCKMHGYKSSKKLIGKNLKIFHNEEQLKNDVIPFNIEVQEKGTYSGEVGHITKDGKLFPTLMTSTLLKDAQGNPFGMTGIARDISKHKAAEEALRQSQEKYHLLVENVPSILWKTSEKGITVFISSNIKEIYGYSPKEIYMDSYNSWLKRIHHDDLPEVKKSFQALFDRGKKFDVAYRIKRKDGEWIWIRDLANVVHEENGEKYAYGVFTDITDYKQMEKALRESEEKYRSIFVAESDGIFLIDAENMEHLDVNDAALELFGYKRDEFLSLRTTDISSEPDKTVKNINSGEIGKGLTVPLRYARKKDGTIFPVEVSASFFKLYGRKTICATIRDITKRKRAEEEKDRLNEQLRRSQKLVTIGTLAGGIAHDFNNILTPIIGYTDIILDELPKINPIYEDLVAIQQGSIRAKELVQQILTFSRQVEKKREPLQLQMIVMEVVKLLRPSIPSAIEIRQNINSSCRKILADPAQIHQVIMNLCTNALQAMEEKGGVLTIELQGMTVGREMAKFHPNLEENEYIRLSIGDTGIGIDEARIDRIFEPFFTTKAEGKGTGLGLSVVHGIIRSHGGDILVFSEPQKGTTFHVYLPAISVEKNIDKEKAAAIQGGNESLLLVDDEEMVCRMLQIMLEGLGYSVKKKNSAIEALEIFKKQPDDFDLVITDLTMPDMTGLELAGELHKIRSKLPIILMTGYNAHISHNIKKYNVMEAIISKPITKKNLAGVIRTILEKKLIMK